MTLCSVFVFVRCLLIVLGLSPLHFVPCSADAQRAQRARTRPKTHERHAQARDQHTYAQHAQRTRTSNARRDGTKHSLRPYSLYSLGPMLPNIPRSSYAGPRGVNDATHARSATRNPYPLKQQNKQTNTHTKIKQTKQNKAKARTTQAQKPYTP